MKSILVFFVVFLSLSLHSFSQETNTAAKDWGFSITPYGLLAFNATDVGGTKIRQSFDDLVNATNAGFQVVAEARYKRFYLSFDGTFASLGNVSEGSILKTDLEIIQNILDFKFGYNVYQNFNFSEDEVLNGWMLILNAGVKYWKNDVRFKYSISHEDSVLDSGNINQVQDWTDLMIGLKTKFYISKKFLLSTEFNVGGFGIGDASKFAYDFIYLNSFKVSKLITINAGFRNFMYRRVDKSTDGDLKTKVNVFGPLIGASFILL